MPLEWLEAPGWFRCGGVLLVSCLRVTEETVERLPPDGPRRGAWFPRPAWVHWRPACSCVDWFLSLSWAVFSSGECIGLSASSWAQGPRLGVHASTAQSRGWISVFLGTHFWAEIPDCSRAAGAVWPQGPLWLPGLLQSPRAPRWLLAVQGRPRCVC